MVPGMDERLEKRRFNRLRQLEAQRRFRLDEFVRASMGLPQGREFMWWLLELAKVGRNPFTANALTTSFNCGELNVGQQIQSHIMTVSPADYLKMLRERQEEQENVEREFAERPDPEPGAESDA